MLRFIIIEDEQPARQHLASVLRKINPEAQIIAELQTVKESLAYFEDHREADIILSDVQLGDGLSFEIFRRLDIRIPVIFTTGYDQFMMNAFEYNGIDYLLKPVQEDELKKSIVKYRMLEKHFIAQPGFSNLVEDVSNRKRTRIVVKKGIENIALRLEDVVLFFTENKIVYVMDRCGKKYLSDKSLVDLEEELETDIFFRVNRQYILNMQYIRGFRPFEKVKLMVELTQAEIRHSIIVSQETAPSFRKWMHEA
jgi:DNA-binding LytR/AlgR family response regulator